MKQDKLEKFVNENREAFDNLEPSGRIWENIRKNEPGRKNYRWLKITMQAAAAILLFVGAYYFHDYMHDNNNGQGMAVKQNKKIETQNQVTIEKKSNETDAPIKIIAENKTEKNNIKHKKNIKKQVNFENKELAEASAYYTDMIQKKKDEVFKCTSDNPDVKKEINNEFGQLDKAFKELQNDLKENVDNSQVIDAMIQNYRMKLEVLEYMKTHVCTAELK
ncbi:MAG: hypothetical protein PHD97_11435 [Bacteroidales bacterium]|nr:hypothetical protein [Bacteroidales bacterium]